MIAYVMYWNEFTCSGVWTKVITQVETWAKFGESVELHLLTESDNLITMPHGIVLKRYVFHSLSERICAWSRLAENVRKSSPTCVYFRYDVPAASILKLAKEFPLVVEVNTNDRIEYRYPMAKRLLNGIGRRILYERVAGIVLVSAELGRMLPPSAFSKPVITIANSVDFEDFKARPPSVNSCPAFLFVASQNHCWQGIDKLCQLAQLLPESTFHLVGDVKTVPTSENLILHGKLTSEEIGELAQNCDIGIGTLALHRKGGAEACPLKVREYLALGLPVIIAYNDTDFPEPRDFILKIPNNEECIKDSIKQIKVFARKWMGQRVSRENVVHIGSKEKENLRLSFLKSVI